MMEAEVGLMQPKVQEFLQPSAVAWVKEQLPKVSGRTEPNNLIVTCDADFRLLVSRTVRGHIGFVFSPQVWGNLL